MDFPEPIAPGRKSISRSSSLFGLLKSLFKLSQVNLTFAFWTDCQIIPYGHLLCFKINSDAKTVKIELPNQRGADSSLFANRIQEFLADVSVAVFAKKCMQ